MTQIGGKSALRRKIRYPKGFDPENPGPPPDPERWLPKRERSEFKPLRHVLNHSRTAIKQTNCQEKDAEEGQTFAAGPARVKYLAHPGIQLPG